MKTITIGERLYISELCSEFERDQGGVLGLALEGKLTLWVELFNVWALGDGDLRQSFRERNLENGMTAHDAVMFFERLCLEVLPEYINLILSRGGEGFEADQLHGHCFSGDMLYVSADYFKITKTLGAPQNDHGTPGTIKVGILQLYALRSEIEAIKGGQSAPLIVPQKQAPPVNNTENKGGAKPKPFRQALLHFCQSLVKSGEAELLKKGNINKFMHRLRRATLNSKLHDPFVAQRIDTVTGTGTRWRITFHDYKGEPQKDKTGADVSTFLTEWRKKNDIPT